MDYERSKLDKNLHGSVEKVLRFLLLLGRFSLCVKSELSAKYSAYSNKVGSLCKI